jgi:hypothetical protein
MSTFVRRHARTLTSYHVAFGDLLRDRHTPPNDSLCPLIRDVRALTRMQTLSVQMPGESLRPWGLTVDALLMVLDAMPDSVVAVVLCPDNIDETSDLGSTDVARVARLPATLSSLRGTALGNLRSLTIGMHMTKAMLLVFPALEYGLPLLMDLRLHVSHFFPESPHVYSKKVVRGCLAHVWIGRQKSRGC